MLIDRLILLQKEIQKQQDKCSKMYKNVAILRIERNTEEYQEALQKLINMKAEAELIQSMIDKGEQ